ncbi:MAG TPA: outer membrane protein transport protein [bacterium]|nr:outer membrane protein transport protein [bacterium]
MGSYTQRIAVFFTLSLLLTVLAPLPAAGNPMDSYGFGARAVGMGGAYTGLADDFSAIYYNVAGLSQIQQNSFSFGFMMAKPFLDLDLHPMDGATRQDARNLHELEKRQVNVDDVNGYNFGVAIPLNKYFHLGVGIYLPEGLVIRLRPHDSHIPTFIMHENRSQRIVSHVGASVLLLPGLSIGGGASILSDSKGTFTFPLHANNRNLSLNPEQESQEPLDVDATLNLDFPLTATPFAGIMWRPKEWLRFGASYRDSFSWNVTIDADVGVYFENYVVDLSELDSIAPGVLPLKGTVELSAPALGSQKLRVPVELSDLEGKIALNASLPVSILVDVSDHWKPQQAAFGASADLGDAWTFSGDVTWYDWSAYPSPDMYIKIDDLRLNLSTLPTSVRARIQSLTVPLLGAVGPLPPVNVSLPGLQTEITIKAPLKSLVKPKTHDIFVPRFGVEHRLPPMRSFLWIGDMQAALRAGYSFRESPFDLDSGYTNLIDMDQHEMSAGLGIKFNETISFDFYGQYYYLVPVNFDKKLIDPDTPFDEISARGYTLAGGVTIGFRW